MTRQCASCIYKEKHIFLADKVFDHILMPRNLNASCPNLSNISLLRKSVEFADARLAAYSAFAKCDEELWPEGTSPR